MDRLARQVTLAAGRGRRRRRGGRTAASPTGPPPFREQLLGRALGRVLAHEIGHYLLAWRAHSPAGLMRASFPGDLPIQPAPEAFRLSELLHPRLRGRIAQLAPQGSTLATIR